MNFFKQTRLILATFLAMVVAALCFASSAHAQCQSYTTVTGTVTDPSGIPYAGATLYVDISPSASNSPSCTSVAGGQQTLAPSDLHKVVTLDATGSFSIQVPPNAIISPASSSWVFTVNLNSPGPIGTGILNFTYSAMISGSSQSLSSSLSALAQSVSRNGGGGVFSGGYSSNAPSGTEFGNLTSHSTLSFTPGTNQASVISSSIIVTGISVNLSAAEGAAATLAFSFAHCTPSGGTCTPISTSVACTVPNNGTFCQASGFNVIVPAGDLAWWQSVQTGTGTTAIGSVSFSYMVFP